jgi:hypothetical protein
MDKTSVSDPYLIVTDPDQALGGIPIQSQGFDDQKLEKIYS